MARRRFVPGTAPRSRHAPAKPARRTGSAPERTAGAFWRNVQPPGRPTSKVAPAPVRGAHWAGARHGAPATRPGDLNGNGLAVAVLPQAQVVADTHDSDASRTGSEMVALSLRRRDAGFAPCGSKSFLRRESSALRHASAPPSVSPCPPLRAWVRVSRTRLETARICSRSPGKLRQAARGSPPAKERGSAASGSAGRPATAARRLTRRARCPRCTPGAGQSRWSTRRRRRRPRWR